MGSKTQLIESVKETFKFRLCPVKHQKDDDQQDP